MEITLKNFIFILPIPLIIGLAIWISHVAKHKGRNEWIWFVLGMIPLVNIFAAIIIYTEVRPSIENDEITPGLQYDRNSRVDRYIDMRGDVCELKRGFSGWAFLFPTLWLLSKNRYSMAFLFFLIEALCGGFMISAGNTPMRVMVVLAYVGMRIVFGAKANDLVRENLLRNGFAIESVDDGDGVVDQNIFQREE